MGCLNDNKQFAHWFGNIHFSGPCNRECYFCIGQFMMEQDGKNNLATWPLIGFDEFVHQCNDYKIIEVNLTGTNTDPALYKHLPELAMSLRSKIDGLILGIRTNGSIHCPWRYFDQISVSCHGISKDVHLKMMSSGEVPDIKIIVESAPCPVRVNYVLSPYNLGDELDRSLRYFRACGVESVNLREPYGQEHIGSPLSHPVGEMFGCPVYDFEGLKVVYWDVHYCGVHSVNLYADGHTSISYPVTKGCVSGDKGNVFGQENFKGHKRRQEQWVG